MSLSVQMRSPKIIVNDDAGVIARGLELLGQFGASPSDRDRAEAAAAIVVALQENDYGSIVDGVVLTADFGSIAA